MKIFCGIILLVSLSITTVQSRGISERIVNGTEIDIREVPYQIHYADECGGSILSNRVIATAAHCIEGILELFGLAFVRAGSSEPKSGGQVIEIKEAIIHPQYEKFCDLSYDFGVLVLKEDLVFNDFVKPIPLAREPALDGTTFVISGWGDISQGGDYDGPLRSANVNQINIDLCKEYYSKAEDRKYVLDESMVCAGFVEGGTDTCQRDSGGPLVFDKKLYGVVSWGRGCAQPGFPGVYGSIPVVYDWYMSFIEN